MRNSRRFSSSCNTQPSRSSTILYLENKRMANFTPQLQSESSFLGSPMSMMDANDPPPPLAPPCMTESNHFSPDSAPPCRSERCGFLFFPSHHQEYGEKSRYSRICELAPMSLSRSGRRRHLLRDPFEDPVHLSHLGSPIEPHTLLRCH